MPFTCFYLSKITITALCKSLDSLSNVSNNSLSLINSLHFQQTYKSVFSFSNKRFHDFDITCIKINIPLTILLKRWKYKRWGFGSCRWSFKEKTNEHVILSNIYETETKASKVFTLKIVVIIV